MARFKESDISQGQFIAVNLSEQLIQGIYEWTLNYLIDRMDLSLFEEKYNNEEPDHATIAAFISTNIEEVKDLFVKVLMQCQELHNRRNGGGRRLQDIFKRMPSFGRRA